MPTAHTQRRARTSAVRTSATEPALAPQAILEPAALYTPPQAARLLQLSVRTLEKWRSEETGPKSLRLGRRVRYRGTDLKDFIDRQARSAVA
jgi:hypothetical protein